MYKSSVINIFLLMQELLFASSAWGCRNNLGIKQILAFHWGPIFVFIFSQELVFLPVPLHFILISLFINMHSLLKNNQLDIFEG